MEAGLTTLGKTGLRFFGMMSAANAHEIKNALAIINENAGLLGDLVAMAEKGMALDPERLLRLADTIRQQVSRADDIAKSTNRFAHSVDNAHGPADLEQSVLLIKTMAMRFATKRHINIEVAPCETAINLPVQPFMLLHLLWLCLQFAMETANKDKTIQIKIQRSGIETMVQYGPLAHLTESAATALSSTAETTSLLELMRGRIMADIQTQMLQLAFEKP